MGASADADRAGGLRPQPLRVFAILALIACAFGVGYFVGREPAPERYTMANAGSGNVIRLNTSTGAIAVFNAECLSQQAKLPKLPKGFGLVGCPDPWAEFRPVTR